MPVWRGTGKAQSLKNQITSRGTRPKRLFPEPSVNSAAPNSLSRVTAGCGGVGSRIEIPGVIWPGEVCVWTKGQYEVSSSITLYLILLPQPHPRPGALKPME